MKSTIKPFAVLLIAAAIYPSWVKAEDKPVSGGSGAATKSAATVEDLFPDLVIIKGKGFEVKRSRFDEDMINVKADAISKGQEIPQAQLPVLERRVLDRLIRDQILLTKATAAEKAKGKEESDKQFEMIRKAESSDEIFSRKLRSVGLTMDRLHSRLFEEFTVQTMLRSKVSVTDDQVKKFYDDNPSKFEEPEMVKVTYILMNTVDPKTSAPLTDEKKRAKRKQMDDVLKRARAGEDFTKLAKEVTEDTSSKESDCAVKFPRGNPRIPPEFEAAAFSMKTNQVSEVITLMAGYCILRLDDKTPARKETLAETSKHIQDYLMQVEVEKMLPQYYADLKKEAGVEILDKELKAIEDIPATEMPVRDAANGKDSSSKSPPK